MGIVGKVFQFFFALVVGVFLLGVTFYLPYLRASVKYNLIKQDNAVVVNKYEVVDGLRNTVVVKDPGFGIVIPKLGINTSVVADVNIFDTDSCNEAFKTGVAHSRGSSLPGKGGNIIIFTHAFGNVVEVQKYNLPFYFLNRLSLGDPVYIYYKDKQYRYEVTRKNVVSEMDINFIDLAVNPKTEILSIVTLWPPGTSMSRYVVDARKI